MEYLSERAQAHFASYQTSSKLCIRKLANTFTDLGLLKEEQLAAFDRIAAAAEGAWSDACEASDLELQALRDRVSCRLSLFPCHAACRHA